MAGYNRNDTVNNIADGNIINASDLDGEFDAIDAAFDETTGHEHDGTSGGGKPITKVGPSQDVVVGATAVTPKTDNTIDLGSSTFEFKDLYIDGTANIDSLVADTADINAGTIDGVTIGTNSAVTDLRVDNLRLDGNTISSTDTNGNIVLAPNGTGDVVPGTDDTYDLGSSSAEWKDLYIDGTANIDSLVADTADINAGTIDGTTIGGSTPAAGAFTTLSASGVATFSAGTVSAPAITTTGDTNTGIFFPTADTIAFTEGGVESMRIDSSGNVGIGTNAPTGKLEVSLNTTTGAGSSAAGTVANFTGVDGTGASVYINSYGASPQLISRSALGTAASPTTLTANQGILRILGLGYNGTAFTASRAEISFAASETWTTTANGTLMTFRTTQNGTTSSAERMRITDAGRVGIGTSTPNQQLEVSASDESIISLIATGTNGKQYNLISTAGSSGIGQGAFAIFDRTASLTRFVINSSGFVGINTTSPAQLFDVVSSGESIISLRSTSTGGKEYNLISSPTGGLGTGVFSIYDRTGNAPRVIIDNNGLVGIGSSLTPEKLLSVFDNNASTTTTSGIVVTNYNATINSRSGIAFKNFDNYGAAIWSPRSNGTLGSLVFGTNGSASTAETNVLERMRLDSSGNLGIGTSSPDTKLYVAGGEITVQASDFGRVKFIRGSTTIWTIGPRNTDDYYIYREAGSGNTILANSGNVGIGTTAPNSRLEVNQTVSFVNIDTYAQLVVKTTSGVNGKMLNIGVDETNNISFIQSVNRGTSANSLVLQRYDGNVGIATSSPQSLLDITQTNNTEGDKPLRVYANNRSQNIGLDFSGLYSTYYMRIQSGASRYIAFETNGNNERMRILSGGEVCIGRTDALAALLNITGSSGTASINCGDAADGTPYGIVQITRPADQPDNKFHLSFIRVGNKIAGMGFLDNSDTFAIQNASAANNTGSGVTLTNNATSWGTTSDERKKDIIAPVENALTKLANWRTVYYKYKIDEADTPQRVGLIAQDVQATLPEAVSAEEDELKTLQVRYTETIPLLVKAIQELKAELDSVKTELQTLKGN